MIVVLLDNISFKTPIEVMMSESGKHSCKYICVHKKLTKKNLSISIFFTSKILTDMNYVAALNIYPTKAIRVGS